MEKRLSEQRPNGMSSEEKKHSWNAIERELVPRSAPFLYKTLSHNVHRKVAAGIFGLLILSGGAATAYANGAKPGDILFPVLVVQEKAQILFAGNTQKKEDLRVHFANKRLSEVRELESLANAEDNQRLSQESQTGSSTKPEYARDDNSHNSLEAEKRIERAKRGANIALAELRDTREELHKSGNKNRTKEIDSIISEVMLVAEQPRRSERQNHGDQKVKIFSTTTSQEAESTEENESRDGDTNEQETKEINERPTIIDEAQKRSHDEETEDENDDDSFSRDFRSSKTNED